MTPSNKVRRVMQVEGISESELHQMARLSVPCHSEFGNRKFHAWILDIRNDVCQNLCMETMLHITPISGRGHIEEDHDACDGEGCKACNWIGRVVRNF